jgi:predicted Zn-dependent protease
VSDGPRLDAARVRVVLGDALLACGDPTAADEYLHAATELAEAGAVRQAAEVWYQLADAFVTLGLVSEALTAYKQVAELAGVCARPPAHASTPVLLRRGQRV